MLRLACISCLSVSLLTVGACSTARPVKSATTGADPADVAEALVAEPSPQAAATAQEVEEVSAGPVRRIYSQVSQNRSRAKTAEFVQVDSREGRLAGTLLDRAELPVSQYMDLHSGRPNRPKLNWSKVRRAEAFFIEFNPPMEEWPSLSGSGQAVAQQATLTACGSDGVPFTSGSAQRRVWHDGTETIETSAGTFKDCTRLRAETELRFGRWATIQVEETAWLSPQAGVVRRTEHLHGRAVVILRFNSTYRYDLKSFEPASEARLVSDVKRQPAAPGGAETPEEISPNSRHGAPQVRSDQSDWPSWQFASRWARLAIHIERSRAGPRVAGLAVDYAGGGE